MTSSILLTVLFFAVSRSENATSPEEKLPEPASFSIPHYYPQSPWQPTLPWQPTRNAFSLNGDPKYSSNPNGSIHPGSSQETIGSDLKALSSSRRSKVRENDGRGREWRKGSGDNARRRVGESHVISESGGNQRPSENDDPFRTAHFSVRPLSMSPLEKQRLESEKFRDSGSVPTDHRPLAPDGQAQNYERYPPHASQDPTRGDTPSQTYRSRYPSDFGAGFHSGPGISQGYGQNFGPGYNGRQNGGFGYNGGYGSSSYSVYNQGYSGSYNTAPSSGIRGWYDRFLSGMSGGYGDQEECDCVAYNLLGLGAAAATSAALAAIFLFANLTNVGRSLEEEWSLGVELLDLTAFLAEPLGHLSRGERVIWDGSDPRSAFGRVLHQLPEGMMQRSLLDLAGRIKPHALADTAVRAVCYGSGYRRKRRSENGTSTITGRFLDKIGIGARDGYASSGGSCDCFAGIVGALAGFAALGALVAFAIATATTTTTTTAAPAAGGGRALMPPDGGGMVDPLTSSFVQRMLLLLTEEQECLPHQLCVLSRDAREAGDPYSTLVQLGSLPLSWFLTKTTGGNMPEYCSGLMTSQVRGQCLHTQERCQS
ncbi:uncharacterized protein LOC122375841 isoform X1 [Amphibalanus amphitrite]|uniref:uncharacterized protein LOC122375841 isoform X1 n=1 Tax=Amphibalanus amphitrite TaxID=1232801 RepID=UPI001C927C67|nr:uncharacterized protein LOC122375841 isoform X1 [Amphibalanus amphitrite]